jgi:hypothetical protein
MGCSEHWLCASCCSRLAHTRTPAGVPPKFALNSRTPPTWSRLSSGPTTFQPIVPRHERTISEPMSASRSHGSALGEAEADADAEGTGEGVRRAVASLGAAIGCPIQTTTASKATTATRPTWIKSRRRKPATV